MASRPTSLAWHPSGLVPEGVRFGAGFAGTRTNGRLPGAGAAVLDYLLTRGVRCADRGRPYVTAHPPTE
jgi:hypothetical protein